MTITETKTAPSTELERVLQTQAVVATNKPLTFKSLAALLAPAVPKPPVTVNVPPPAALTDEQKEALILLPKVFGQVVVSERRSLTLDEIKAMREEKAVLATLASMSEKRNKSLRTMFFNHADVAFEATHTPEEIAEAWVDNDGHYITTYAVPVPGTTKTLKRETTEGSHSISATKLKAMADDPNEPDFNHDDWLAVTEQIRQFSEVKFLDYVKKHPAKLHAIVKAASTSAPTASFWLR